MEIYYYYLCIIREVRAELTNKNETHNGTRGFEPENFLHSLHTRKLEKKITTQKKSKKYYLH